MFRSKRQIALQYLQEIYCEGLSVKRPPLLFATLLLGVLSANLTAQTSADQKLSFDVASVRENKTGLPPTGDAPDMNVPLGPGDVYSPTGGLLTTKNVVLIQFIAFAYRLTSSQMDELTATAPAWVTQSRYNLQARTDRTNVTKNELRLMMRSLLEDRFGLVVHYEAKVTSVFAMQLVKAGTTGPRLRPHPADGCSRSFRNESPDAPAPADSIDGGYPTVCGGLVMLPSSTPTHFSIGARDVPITNISNALPSWGDLGRPVVDQTGLTGNYDFALDFVPKRPDPPLGTPVTADLEEPNFLEALKKQLGVKLESQKQPIQVLVLDHITPLTDN
jgi:uncharacterized protein (TIGR03435 family)